MSSQEIQLPITPQQAAEGTTVTIPLPNGTARLRIPPSRDGDLVRARFGDNEVLLRIRVTTAAVTPPAPPKKSSSPLGCLVALGVVAAVLIAFAVANADNDDDANNTASATPTSTYSPTPEYSSTPYETPTYTYEPTTKPTLPSLPDPTPTRAVPTPFDKGTCLNGQLPDSETAQSVSNVDEVSCSASDAHYKVIQRFPFSSDMEQCKSNPDTEYAFSYRYTLGGSVINQYVYCLIGLGSYSRS